jgi:tetratricopeptide (TPR) repeat protein
MKPTTYSPRPTVAPTIAPTTVAASNCRSTIATAPTPSLLKANYSSMEDAYDNVQHGHASYECAEILIEELAQYDKAEPYLWCVLDHCAGCDVNGMCPTAYLSLETTSKCESAVWNYLGFVNRKKAAPDYAHAQTYYDKALELWPANCGALSYMTELYLTTGNATAARATHADFCTACDGPSEDAVAALGRCPTPAPSDVVDAARRRGPTVFDGVLMVLSLVVVGYLLSFMACEPPGCGRDPKPFQGNKW